MKEEWRVIEDVPVYAVSNLGRVKRVLPGHGTYVGRIMNLQTNPTGYMVAQLSNGGKVWRTVHRLVLEAFVGKRPAWSNGCNHEDGDKTNNKLSNLNWTTQSENEKHAHRTGLKIMPKGEVAYNVKLKDNEVWLIKKLLSSNVVTQRFIAKMFKIHFGTIHSIVKGHAWKQIIYIEPKDKRTKTTAAHIKLQDREVWLIKKLLDKTELFQKDIGKSFKVSLETISQIKRNIIWKQVKYP